MNAPGNLTPVDFHPIAGIWPLLSEQELDELAEDIKENGLHNPIWRHRDGRIIDGRNRWLACQKVGVECPSNVYAGEDGPKLGAFVWSMNEKRRHLTTDQRSAVGEDYRAYLKSANWHSGDTATAAATLMGVSRRSITRAAEVKRADPTLHEAVKAGTLKAGKARAIISQRKVDTAKAVSVRATATADTRTVRDLADLVNAGLRFGTIYADPPWLYDNQSTRSATKNHYEGMTVEQLCKLPVRTLVADAAHLHLWTTNAFLFECPKLFDAWGFEFRSTFVWCKEQMGIGNYRRNSHEIMLTAVRGDAKSFADHSLMSWMVGRRGRHSAKPEQVRHMIERASPGPRLELFGRGAVKDWWVYGNDPSLDEPSLLVPQARKA